MSKDITVPCHDGYINVRVGAIIMKDGKVLMAGSKIRPEYLYTVGGRVQFGETSEEAVRVAIRNAEGLGYNPIDLEKMHRLYEIVTGQRTTPTPQYDPTMAYSIQQTGTAVAISLNPTKSSGNSVPQPDITDGTITADSDPFGTGIQATTDPNALPQLDLPAAPTITPNPDIQ